MLGGLIATNGVINTNFYFMIEILLIFKESSFVLKNGNDITLEWNHRQLRPGQYYVAAAALIVLRSFIPSLVTRPVLDQQ